MKKVIIILNIFFIIEGFSFDQYKYKINHCYTELCIFNLTGFPEDILTISSKINLFMNKVQTEKHIFGKDTAEFIYNKYGDIIRVKTSKIYMNNKYIFYNYDYDNEKLEINDIPNIKELLSINDYNYNYGFEIDPNSSLYYYTKNGLFISNKIKDKDWRVRFFYKEDKLDYIKLNYGGILKMDSLANPSCLYKIRGNITNSFDSFLDIFDLLSFEKKYYWHSQFFYDSLHRLILLNEKDRSNDIHPRDHGLGGETYYLYKYEYNEEDKKIIITKTETPSIFFNSLEEAQDYIKSKNLKFEISTIIYLNDRGLPIKCEKYDNREKKVFNYEYTYRND
jgi:hypothetical protein